MYCMFTLCVYSSVLMGYCYKRTYIVLLNVLYNSVYIFITRDMVHVVVVTLVPGLLIAVGNELVIKLADFGMARNVRDKDSYHVAGKARLPVKWMAPESLLYGEFSEATDVW